RAERRIAEMVRRAQAARRMCYRLRAVAGSKNSQSRDSRLRGDAMSVARGTRFGPYEIAALIGVGGMGEVYRATDTNLKRDVALKLLPENFVTDATRLARLQPQAEVLAALNHPNVAQIFGIERAASDGRTA